MSNIFLHSKRQREREARAKKGDENENYYKKEGKFENKRNKGGGAAIAKQRGALNFPLATSPPSKGGGVLTRRGRLKRMSYLLLSIVRFIRAKAAFVAPLLY